MMPLFLLRYMSSKFEVVGLAILEAKDSILARRKAEVDEIHQPGLPAVVDELDPGSISPDLIGCRLSLDDVIINKPPAPSVRRRAAAPPLKLVKR
jgi:hypothetical protein